MYELNENISLNPKYEWFSKKCLAYIKEKNYKVDLNYYINDDCLSRFLIARQKDQENAFILWKKWIDWRVEDDPEKITQESVAKELKTGKVFLHGFDKEGRPCIVFKSGLHFPDQSDFEEAQRLGIYLMEKASKLSDEKGVKQIVCIVDREKASMKNVDRKMLGKTGVAQLLQDYYPERLFKIYILHVNWIYRIMYGIIKVFLSKSTIEKIEIIADIKDLKKYFSDENLLISHGGNSNFVYNYPN